jgi:opacity protein-like surface antigen
VFAQGTVGAGLSFLHDDGATATGFTIDYASVKPATDKATFGFVGDFGLNKFDGGTVTSYLGGVRVAIPGSAKVKPFAQFVLGAEHCCDSTNLTLQPGAGVDIAVSPTLSVRVQIDFRNVRFDGGSANEQRYTFGVAIPVGGKK